MSNDLLMFSQKTKAIVGSTTGVLAISLALVVFFGAGCTTNPRNPPFPQIRGRSATYPSCPAGVWGLVVQPAPKNTTKAREMARTPVVLPTIVLVF